MATVAQAFAYGARITASVSGQFQTVTNSPATFEEKARINLLSIGFDTPTIALSVKGGLEKVIGGDWISEPFTAVVTVNIQSPVTRSTVQAMITSAFEKAGAYSPGVSITSAGDPAQQTLQEQAGIVDALLQGIGGVAKGIGKAAETIPGLSWGLVVGIVVIVGLVAFGPNLKGVGGRL